MLSRKFWILVATAVLLIAGCAEKTPTATKAPVKETNTTKVPVPQRVNKKIELKEVQDNNYSPAYMYPEDKVQKEKVVKMAKAETTEAETTINGMSKKECISMIGEEKFIQYTQMFGNEVSSIKRCAMIKSMQ